MAKVKRQEKAEKSWDGGREVAREVEVDNRKGCPRSISGHGHQSICDHVVGDWRVTG